MTSFPLTRVGLRSRLGRLSSRSVVLWSIVAVVICGLFTAAAASRLAWETARAQPNAAEAAAIFASVLPDHPVDRVYVPPAMFTFYGQPLSWADTEGMLFLDGGEYGFSSTGIVLNGIPSVSQERTLATAIERLKADGWFVYQPVVDNAVDCAGPPCDPNTLPTDTVLIASRGDTALRLELMSESTSDTTYLAASLSRMTPPAVIPVGAAAGLLGAVLAWLVFGWASRRTPDGQPLVKGLFGLAMFLWWSPVALVAPQLLTHHRHEPHPQWHPLWEWLGQPTLLLFFLAGTGCALLALGLAAYSGRASMVIVSRAAKV